MQPRGHGGTSGGRSVLLAAACLTSALAVAGCGSNAPVRSTVATAPSPSPSRAPAPRATIGAPGTPQDVVEAYVAAVNRHDDAAAYALMTPDWARVVRAEVDGLPNIVSITDLVLLAPISENGTGTAAHGYRQVIFVPVRFTLRQRQVVSLKDGPTAWGYLLARDDTRQPWLIADEGPV